MSSDPAAERSYNAQAEVPTAPSETYTRTEPSNAEPGSQDGAKSTPTSEHTSPDASAVPTVSAIDSEREPDYITGTSLYLVIFAVTFAAVLLFLDFAIISTAIPRITDEFNSLPDVGWYAGAYQLSSAALMPLAGKVFQRFSSKWSFIGFFALFELGSLLCGVANSSKMLIVGRAVAGMGGSGIFTGALTIIASCLPLQKRAMATGIIIGISQLGIVLGPLLGGAFTEYSTWRWSFYFNLPTGGLCLLILAAVRIPDQIEKGDPLTVLRRLHHELDLVGFALFAPAAIMLLLALEYGGNQFSWNSSTVIGLFCGAGVTLLIWLAWDWHAGDNALIPFSMAMKRPVWTSSLTQAFSMTTLYMISYFLPVFFQAVQDASPVSSGVQMLPSILTQLLFGIIAGALVSRTGYTIPYALFGTACGAVGSGLLSTLTPSSSLGQWFGYQVIAGTGRGITTQMPIISLQASLKPAEISPANSLLMFSQTLASAILIVISNTVLDVSLRSRLPIDAPGVNVEAVIAAGATGFRNTISEEDVSGVIRAYASSIDNVFYIGAACAILSFFFAFGMGWVDIRKKSTKTRSASEDSELEAGQKA